jgi:hypothetical protein
VLGSFATTTTMATACAWRCGWARGPRFRSCCSSRICGRALAGMNREVMLLGTAGLVDATVVWSWFNAGLALHPDTLDPPFARTVADVSAYFGPVLTLSIILLIAPIGLAAWRREVGFRAGLRDSHRVRRGAVDRDHHGLRDVRLHRTGWADELHVRCVWVPKIPSGPVICGFVLA